jgi:hypothetical protein
MIKNQSSSIQKGEYRKTVIYTMLALLLSFASLAPGGPFENRDFSHLPRPVFNGFNAFLISLGIVGFVTVFLIWKEKIAAYWIAIVVGWLYVIVVASDLGKVFPVSPDHTGFALGMILIVDAILAFYIVLFSHKALGHI